MKAYKILFCITLGLILLPAGSCDKKFDEINTDPNRATEVLTPYLLTAVQRYIAYNYYDSWQGLRMNGVIGQQWCQRTYTEEDRYDFSGRTGTIANFFNLAYFASQYCNEIIRMNEEFPDEASVYGDNKTQIASARVLKAWLIILVCQTFGDVPYTEANDIYNNLTPKFDTQDFIFRDLIRELKEVNNLLQGVTSGWTRGDILLGGSPEKWRRFANSLRLQIAMRMSNVDPSFSATEAMAAINDGVMRNNDDNATFYFLSMASPNANPKYDTYASRMDFIPSWQFVNMLFGEDDDNIGFKNPFKGIVDPRFIQFVQSPADQAAGVAPKTMTPPMGLLNADNNSVYNSFSPTTSRISYGPTQSRQDNILAKPVQAAFWSTFLDFPNVAFLIAERLDNDRDFFAQGIQASLDIWGVDQSEADDYLSAVMAKFDAANSEGKYEMIITQKYIHNFAHYDQESVFEYRRTEYPKSVVLPGQQSGGTYQIGGVDRTFTFTPLDGSTIFLQRMMYPNTQQSTNADSYKAAVSSMGGDRQDIPLYYAKGYKK